MGVFRRKMKAKSVSGNVIKGLKLSELWDNDEEMYGETNGR